MAFTKFATKNHPWTGEKLDEKMTTAKTKQVNYSEVESLSIAADPIPGQRFVLNKYSKIFSELKVGQNIRCKPNDVNRISNALRKHIETKRIFSQKGKPVRVISQSSSPDGIGRIWMIEDTRRVEGVEK